MTGSRLPALWVTGRRKLLLLLVMLGALLGALSVAISWLIARLAAQVVPETVALVGLMVAGFFVGKMAERVVAERVGQDYVAQLRLALLGQALTAERPPAVGITAARSSNDLSAVRLWVTQGLVPLVAGVPQAVLVLCGLAWIDPQLALLMLIPLAVEALVLGLLARPMFAAARIVRRRRGRLAARVADTALAAPSIAAGGGVRRELRRFSRDSHELVRAAVVRARWAGVLRSAALSLPLLGTVLLVLGAVRLQLTAGELAAALTLLAILGASMGEWGRIVEYRQNYLAARRIIAPLITEFEQWQQRESSTRRQSRSPEVAGAPILQIQQWQASAGELIQLSGAAAAVREFATDLASGRLPATLAGQPVHRLPERERRALVGIALSHMPLERGPLMRALRYRRPHHDTDAALKLATECGLSLAGSAQLTAQTQLRHGGQPLDTAERAALLLARALLGQPPLLVIDVMLLATLDPASRQRVQEKLREHTGVVLLLGEPGELATQRQWRI